MILYGQAAIIYFSRVWRFDIGFYMVQGMYGYPIEIQALFFFALRCARQMLKPEHDGKELIERIDKRITALSYHIRNYYWLDFTQLNNIYRYKTEEYSHTAVNKFNVIPESIPEWVFEFMPLRGGYFIGNVSPARMDFRWFLVGNCIAILSSLATPAQATAIMDLIEERWEELIGEMPLKVAYPALEGHEWRIVTGCDPKNTRWSYHNGGSWPGTCMIYLHQLSLVSLLQPWCLVDIMAMDDLMKFSTIASQRQILQELHNVSLSLKSTPSMHLFLCVSCYHIRRILPRDYFFLAL